MLAIVGAVVVIACNILCKVGYWVTREYYVNDAGVQQDVLARSNIYDTVKRWERTSERSHKGCIRKVSLG